MARTSIYGLTLSLLFAACTIAPQPAELVLTGGTVWSDSSGAHTVEAIAVRGGQIVYMGSTPKVERFVGPNTTHIKLNGRVVVPGFIATNVHFLDDGFALGSIDLRNTNNARDFVRAMSAHAKTIPGGRWITGGSWDDAKLSPRRQWIDSVTRENPVAVKSADGRSVLANTLALQLAGITRETKDPSGGAIVRDRQTGEPTGVLKDGAMDLLSRAIPNAAPQERAEALHRAQAHALSNGITKVEDFGDFESLATYRVAHALGDLKIRVYSLVPLDSWVRLHDYINHNGNGDARIHWGGVHATLNWPDTINVRRWALAADRAGLQLVMTAVGDSAANWLRQLNADVDQENGKRDRVSLPFAVGPLAPSRRGDMIVLAQTAKEIDPARLRDVRVDYTIVNGEVVFTRK